MTAPTSNGTNGSHKRLNWALQPPPPPAEKLRVYAQQLPEIYRDILVSFQNAEPQRTQGAPLALGTIQNHLVNEGAKYTEAELTLAIDNLTKSGILSEPEFMTWFAPTRLGEALIEVLTGRAAHPVTVPELPKPTW